MKINKKRYKEATPRENLDTKTLSVYRPIIPMPIRVKYIVIGNIKLNGDEVLNVPRFTHSINHTKVVNDLEYPPEIYYIPGPIMTEEVEINLQIKDRKMRRLMDLFQEQKTFPFSMHLDNGVIFEASGFLTRIDFNSLEFQNEATIVFSPNYFNVL